MTAFTPTDIPSSVNSLEKLHVWSATILNHLYPGTTIVEESGRAELQAQSSTFMISQFDPPEWHNISRVNIRVNRNWQRQGKLWEHAADIGSMSIPTEFKA